MKYKEESFVLDSIADIIEFIKSPDIKLLIKETHENNIMLKQIVNIINTYITNHHNENEDDFNRNILANIISNTLDLSIFNRQ